MILYAVMAQTSTVKLFVAGIVLFSGSLYLLALTSWKFLGPLTPLGGAAFIAGWLALTLLARAGH